MEEITVCSNAGLICAEFCDTSAFVDDVQTNESVEFLEI